MPDLTPANPKTAPIACQIRPARLTDLEALTDVLTSSFHPREGLLGLMYPVTRMMLREDLRNRLRSRSRHVRCLVAVPTPTAATSASAPILGTIEVGLRSQCFLPWYAWFQRVPYISNLAVLAAYRRQGIASQLLAACEPIAQGWQGTSLYLHVMENNSAARALYRQMGYEVVSDRPANPAMTFLPFDFGMSRQLLLRKALPASSRFAPDG